MGMLEYSIYKLIFNYSEFSKSPKFLHSYSSQESAKTDKYIGVFAKLRVIERVAYNFKTLNVISLSNFYVSLKSFFDRTYKNSLRIRPT